MFAKLSAEKGRSDDCHVIEKAKSNRIEVTELYFFIIASKSARQRRVIFEKKHTKK